VQQQCVWYRVLGPGQALQGRWLPSRLRLIWKNTADPFIACNSGVDAWSCIAERLALAFGSSRTDENQRGAALYDSTHIIDPQAIENGESSRALDTLTSRDSRFGRERTLPACECDGGLFSTPVLEYIGLRNEIQTAPNFSQRST